MKSTLLDELIANSPAAAMRGMRRWPSGLSLVHLHVLAVLDVEGLLQMRALAESLDVSQASMTGIVDRMEQRGLVERQRDESDRRVVRVSLTADGRAMVGGMAAERRERLSAMLDDMTDEEIKSLLVGIRAMRRAREHLHARLAAAEEPAR
jgi:DNA-binding MarR family transcriptional regulator